MSKKVRQRHLRRLQEQDGASPAAPQGLSKFEAITVLAIGLAFCLAVAVELGGTTPEGTLQLTHWTPWRDLGILHTSIILLPAFPLIAWVLWKARNQPASPGMLVAILAVASLALQALGLVADPRGLSLVSRIVVSPATTYFTDAARIHGLLDWLRHFHQVPLGFHSQTHPPGPILFYYFFLQLFGSANGALVGGWTVGLLAAAGVLVMYPFAGLWTSDSRTRITACALYALIPALTLFFPEFDQVYPVFSMLLAIFWVKALATGEVAPALATGAVLFLASFSAYNLLALGAFLGYYALYWWLGKPGGSIFKAAGLAIAVFAGLYLLLWAAVGYHPLEALQRSLAAQEVFANVLHRAYERFIFLDVYDLFLGAGMLAFPILLFHLSRRRTQPLTWIALATILTVDLSGLLRGETARVWLFLQPMLVVPVSLELAETPWNWQLSIFALQWWVLAFLKAKMTFLEP